MRRMILIAYLVIGVVVAAARNYFERLDNVKGIISLLIAIVLWPIVLFDVDVRIDKDGGGRNRGLFLPIGMMWSMVSAQVSRLRHSE